MTNNPIYTIRECMGAKDEYIALNLWETHTDEHGNFRPARFLLENEEEEILENVEK